MVEGSFMLEGYNIVGELSTLQGMRGILNDLVTDVSPMNKINSCFIIIMVHEIMCV